MQEELGKKIDLTGQRFGKLVVLGDSGERTKNGDRLWKCNCDCGNMTSQTGTLLRLRKNNSCGCVSQNGLFRDLTGKRFGRLVVVKKSENRTKKGRLLWECKCDCGNTTDVAGMSLKNEHTVSCGCYRREVLKKRDAPQLVESLEKISWREGTALLNLTSGIPSNNTSGVRGVSWNKKRGTWIAHMQFKGETVLREEFTNKQDAIDARKEAEEKYFKPILEKYGKEL